MSQLPNELRDLCEKEAKDARAWAQARNAKKPVETLVAYEEGYKHGFLKLLAVLQERGILPRG